jgi:hypothetical protein
MSNTRKQELGKILTDNEPALIYDILAREELDKESRYKLLKKYRFTDEGLLMLASTLAYAKQVQEKAIRMNRPDPYERSGWNDHQEKLNIPKRVIDDLEANIKMGRHVEKQRYAEPYQVYDMLAKEDLDITFRNELLKAYRRTDDGLQVLMSTVDYAMQMEQKAIKAVKHDPYDRSGYDDYKEKTKMPKRVIEDLKANIRMGRLAKTHPFWHKKKSEGHVDSEPVSVHKPGLNH